MLAKLSNRRGTDPYARWWGRGGVARRPPIPIRVEGYSILVKTYAGRQDPAREWLYWRLMGIWTDTFRGELGSSKARGRPPYGPLIRFLSTVVGFALEIAGELASDLGGNPPPADTLRDGIDREKQRRKGTVREARQRRKEARQRRGEAKVRVF